MVGRPRIDAKPGALAGVPGFLLGIIFLVIALLVGRDKQVVVVKAIVKPEFEAD